MTRVVDIYYNKPFTISALESIAVSPEALYVGVYSRPEAPVKFTITREGATLYLQPGSQSAAPLPVFDSVDGFDFGHNSRVQG